MSMNMSLNQLVTSPEVLDWYDNITLWSLASNTEKQESLRAIAILDMVKRHLPKEYKVASPQNNDYKFLNVRAVKENPEDFFFVMQEILSTKVMTKSWKDYFYLFLAYSPTLSLLILRSPLWLLVTAGLLNLVIFEVIKHSILYFVSEGLGFDLFMVIDYKKSNPVLYKEYIAAMAYKATDYVVKH